MLLKELARLSSQHRTIYCYVILSIWIFLLIAGMYKYIGSSGINPSFSNAKHYYNNPKHVTKNEISKIKKFQQDCNPPQNIVQGDEGGTLEGWTLQGVLLLTRHGDRGPMAHVRGIGTVDCGNDGDPLLNRYKTFLTNSSMSASFGHRMWLKTGPFHGFPLLPPLIKACLLGQLTYRGIVQHLHVGEIIRQAYGFGLGLLQRPQLIMPPKPSNANTSDSAASVNPMVNTDNIVIYSTRYRRTFQSAMALLYTFLPVERWMSLNIRESHSLSFCFSDCACQQADLLKNLIAKESNTILQEHPAVSAVVHWIGLSLLQNPAGQLHPLEVRDAVLALLCHDAPLPCRKMAKERSMSVSTPSTSTTDPDNSDVINIDQDEFAGIVAAADGQHNTVEVEDIEPETEPDGCVEETHVAALMSYTHWQGLNEAHSTHTRRAGLLRAYGLIRNIVNYMLKMVSGDKIKFVLYSGHDRTLQYISAALGLTIDSAFIPYAARMAFEVYKSDKEPQFYFRLIYNGHDLTNQISFCEGGKSLRVNRGMRGNKADLCPIENIIRFIHDDYFISLNATNYKDACTIQKNYDF